MMLKKNTRILFPESFKSSGILFFLFSACFVFWLIDFWRPYNFQKGEGNFVWDMYGYYAYLPGLFQNHGNFNFPAEILSFNMLSPNGNYMPKYTMGVAILQLPFFLLAWAYSEIAGIQGNAFNQYYAVFQEYGTIIYVLTGLWLIRKVLMRYYSEFVVTFTMFVTLYGSLLFHYTFVQAEMAHAYLFFLFCVFIFLVQKWHDQPSRTTTVKLALTLGLISLVRPTEIFIAVFFLLWDVKSMQQLFKKAKSLVTNWQFLSTMLAGGIVVWIPQLIFWKIYTGEWLFDSYQNERFFWFDPQIINVLFSYRKGWFVYTPIIFLVVIGLFALKKSGSPLTGFGIGIVTFLMIYIYSCWWTWDYGGCYGAREFTQHIAYLVFPLAALFERLFNLNYVFVLKRFAGLVVVAFCFLAVTLTIGQSYQFQVQRKIDPSRMSKGIYWELFGTYQYSKRFNEYTFWSLLSPDRAADWREGKNRDDK